MFKALRSRALGSLLTPILLAACSGQDGAAASDVTPSQAPLTQVSTPIKHVVVIIKENHTFDNYFGSFPGAEGTLVGNQNLCNSPTGRGPCLRAPDKPSHDMSHNHAQGIVDWDNGKMDGWSKQGGSDTGDGINYSQYTEKDIPNYYEYARHFVLGDHFFANMIGPSLPGHMFTVAAQAGWAIEDPPTDLPLKITGFPPKLYGPHPYWGCDEWPGDTVPILKNGVTPADVFPCFDIPSIPDVLPQGVDWKFYGSNFAGFFKDIWTPFDAINGIRNDTTKWGHVVGTAEFSDDVAKHVLPAVTWLVDQDQYSEHPHLTLPGVNLPLGGVCDGEGWTVGFINQIMQSEYWKDTAILFTMDDYGGWEDHVPPPRQYGGSATEPYGLGFRLPLLLISPYAKPGFIFKEVSEQASIASFIEAIFHSTATLSSLDPAAQDGQANNLLNAFDFNQTPLPPLVLQPHSCTNANDSLGGATGIPSGPAPVSSGGASNASGGASNANGGASNANGGASNASGGASNASGGSSGAGDVTGPSNGGDSGAFAIGDAGATSDPQGGASSSGGKANVTGHAGSRNAVSGSGNDDNAGATAIGEAGASSPSSASSQDSSSCSCSAVGSSSSAPRTAVSLGLLGIALVASRRRRRVKA